MPTATALNWRPGADLDYILPLGQGQMVAVRLPASSLRADRGGRPVLLPSGIRILDRIRSVFQQKTRVTPGFVVSLREAMGLTQEAFGARLGVSKMTVSRWECCRIRPSAAAERAIKRLRQQARRAGVLIDGARRRTS